jgi:hypothetical protein
MTSQLCFSHLPAGPTVEAESGALRIVRNKPPHTQPEHFQLPVIAFVQTGRNMDVLNLPKSSERRLSGWQF